MTAIILGIVGLLCCAPFGIYGLFMTRGIKKRAAVAGSQVDQKIQVGYILCLVVTILFAIGVLLLLVGLLFAGGSSSGGTTSP